MKKGVLILAAVAIVTFHVSGQNANSDLSGWNIITSDNLEELNADVQGLTYVGGNVTVNNSFNVGTAGSGVIPTATTSLAVVGNITGGVNVQVNGGSVVAGGNITDSFNMNSHGTVRTNDPSALPASPVNTVASASQYWSNLSANSSAVYNSGNQQLDFNCTASSATAVFNLSASQMFGSGYQGFTLNPVNGTTTQVLINISGSTANWTTGSFFSQFNTAEWDGQVLLNFYQAGTVSLSGQLGGYIVAPDATVTLNTSITGGIMCSNLIADGEVDLADPSSSSSAWDGALPVPEPSASALAAIGGLSLLAIFARRRR